MVTPSDSFDRGRGLQSNTQFDVLDYTTFVVFLLINCGFGFFCLFSFIFKVHWLI